MTKRCPDPCISRRSALLLGMTTALTACAVGPMPVAQAASDPSNPSAPEGAKPAAVSAVAPREKSEHGEHAEPHDHAQHQSSVLYVCPMHPEVQSPEPGTCPKCNMKLEPKK